MLRREIVKELYGLRESQGNGDDISSCGAGEKQQGFFKASLV